MIPNSTAAAVHALAREQRSHLAEMLAAHGLHPGQDLLLLEVWQEPGLPQRELAARLRVEPPTVTRMVQRLERGGMIERRPDLDDARVMCVYPSARSRLLESTVRRAWQSLDAELSRVLGSPGAEQLQRLAAAALVDGAPKS